MRYADVLLIYAEAMIEQNPIDDSVLKAINMGTCSCLWCECNSY